MSVVSEVALADDEAAFWRAAARPGQFAAERGAGLVDYLTRAMLLPARLGRPEDVAYALASYAREARARLERGTRPPWRGCAWP